MIFKINELNYEDYIKLRKFVGWNIFSEEQTRKSITNSLYTVTVCENEEIIGIDGRSSIQLIAEKGMEEFYIKKGFKLIPHEHCGSGMRKIIRK